MLQEGRGEDGKEVVGVKEEAEEEEGEEEDERREAVCHGPADARTLALLLDSRKKHSMDQCQGGGEEEEEVKRRGR